MKMRVKRREKATMRKKTQGRRKKVKSGGRRENDGGDESELKDRRGERKRVEWSGRRRKGGGMRNDIYRRRQSLVSVSSGGSEAHLSVFLNQHCASNLLSFACSFPPSRSLSLSQIGLLSACRPSRKRTSLCCSLISPCAPH